LPERIAPEKDTGGELSATRQNQNFLLIFSKRSAFFLFFFEKKNPKLSPLCAGLNPDTQRRGR
jgi:hypothetical protein